MGYNDYEREIIATALDYIGRNAAHPNDYFVTAYKASHSPIKFTCTIVHNQSGYRYGSSHETMAWFRGKEFLAEVKSFLFKVKTVLGEAEEEEPVREAEAKPVKGGEDDWLDGFFG